MRLRRWIPVEGREMPGSRDSGQRPQTLKSRFRSLNGETVKRMETRRRASFSNFARWA